MLDAYIYNGLRTPFGRNAGALAKVRPDNMLGDIIRAAVDASSFSEDAIDDVVAGCGNQAGEDALRATRFCVPAYPSKHRAQYYNGTAVAGWVRLFQRHMRSRVVKVM